MAACFSLTPGRPLRGTCEEQLQAGRRREVTLGDAGQGSGEAGWLPDQRRKTDSLLSSHTLGKARTLSSHHCWSSVDHGEGSSPLLRPLSWVHVLGTCTLGKAEGRPVGQLQPGRSLEVCAQKTVPAAGLPWGTLDLDPECCLGGKKLAREPATPGGTD